jgi:release factor glutamine methyltransferase
MFDEDSDGRETSIAVALERARTRLLITPQAATAGRDAELLLRHVTGLSRAALLTHPERPLGLGALEGFFQAVERRAASEPVQYITGVQEFYGLEFLVTPAVLIPRPETEHLVEAALELARSGQRLRQGGPRILDIGTGSGAIAVTLAHLLPEAFLSATDISSEALAIAEQNASRQHVRERIQFFLCDLFPTDAGPFDLICSNPPYIPSAEVLEVQVAAFEPHSALFAGSDGLDIYRRLVPLAQAALKPGGWLLLEIGHGQRADIESLLHASHLENVRFVPDLQGIARVAVAQKRSE